MNAAEIVAKQSSFMLRISSCPHGVESGSAACSHPPSIGAQQRAGGSAVADAFFVLTFSYDLIAHE